MKYTLKKQSSGAFALHDRSTRETMHPGLGPWEEANRLYVGGAGLSRLLRGLPGGSPEVVLFDVGLGGAANALAALACHEHLREAGRKPLPLRIVSFENDLEPPRFALEQSGRLPYLQGREAALESLLEDRVWGADGVTWELRLGDFTRTIREEPRRADVFFYDPFSPRANPEMWSLPTLEAVHGCRRPGVSARLLTYSSSAATRATLLLAGFYVGAGPTLAGRRQTSEAATEYAALAAPLEARWLSRWKRERDPWPCLTPRNAHRKVREALQAHPQWSVTPPERPAAPEEAPDGPRGQRVKGEPHGLAGRAAGRRSAAAGETTRRDAKPGRGRASRVREDASRRPGRARARGDGMNRGATGGQAAQRKPGAAAEARGRGPRDPDPQKSRPRRSIARGQRARGNRP